MNASAKPALLSWSGGKDAAWVLHLLRDSPTFKVVALLTTFREDLKEAAGQSIAHSQIVRQAAQLQLPLIEMWIPGGASNDDYCSAFAQAIRKAQSAFPGLDDIFFGDIFLADIKAWRSELCASLQMNPHFPLFGMSSPRLARQMLEAGLSVRVSAVDPMRLPAGLAQSEFNLAFLESLPRDVDPCGENGEFHTQVVIETCNPSLFYGGAPAWHGTPG